MKMKELLLVLSVADSAFSMVEAAAAPMLPPKAHHFLVADIAQARFCETVRTR